MNMQVATQSSRAARCIVRYVLSNGWMLVVSGYMAALLSIALWAAWQLVVSYAEPRRELVLEVDRAPARITRTSTELLGTSLGLSASRQHMAKGLAPQTFGRCDRCRVSPAQPPSHPSEAEWQP